MPLLANKSQRWRLGAEAFALGLMAIVTILLPLDAQALPSFARQTGQNCMACHAGGQFPELTPYGRMFKLTGYTIGERVNPLSVMGVATHASVSDTTKTDSPATDFYKHQTPIFATGSLLIAGKVTDNIGAFTQITYDNYASDNGDGTFSGHTNVDNIDIRYANHILNGKQDWVYGVSLNNNPSISDPWNTAAAWMQYVPVPSPSSHQFIDGNAPYPSFGSGGNVAGITTYMYWNKTIYAEAGLYRTADNAFRLLSTGTNTSEITRLSGTNPYWRLAYTREWGAHNLMVGSSGMLANVYDGSTDPSDPAAYHQIRNTGIDSQYQYILDPHTFTAQLAYMRTISNYSPNSVAAASSPYFLANGVTAVNAPDPSDTINVFRAKASYVYRTKYGGSLSFFNKSGNINTLNQTSGFDAEGQITSADSARVTGNLSGNPATRGFTYEAFWMPQQNVRLGAQYTVYNKYNGATDNYDGFGRNASDNNTLFLYAWFAF
jgi:hypothetical protein